MAPDPLVLSAMSEYISTANCFDENTVPAETVSIAIDASPRESFMARHVGHTVVDAAILRTTSDTVALKCVDCQVAFAT